MVANSTAPHVPHVCWSAEPQALQNRASGGCSAPHDAQATDTTGVYFEAGRAPPAASDPSGRTVTPSSRSRALTRNWNAAQGPVSISTMR